MKLDLHGTRHQNVAKKVDSFVWEAMKNHIHQIEIITGKSTIMKNIVTNCLDEYGFIPNEIDKSVGSLTFDLTFLI
jgi:DNA-nicking Smr family endonuclease